MRISDWSSDVCSSDLTRRVPNGASHAFGARSMVTDFLPPSLPVKNPDTLTLAVAIQPAFRELTTRSDEHTSELQSLMCISYAVFCLKSINQYQTRTNRTLQHSNHCTSLCENK